MPLSEDTEKGDVPSSASAESADPSIKKTLMSPWLSAYHNAVAGIKAGSNCMRLVDVYGDGDAKLVIADGDQRLKMFKGSSLHGEQAILGVPSSLSYFYSDNSRPRIPAIAVASGPYIFIYRNFRPHYRFTVPSVEIDAQETKLWESLAKCTIEVPDALTQFSTMRGLGIRLSERSRGLLAIDNIEEQAEYVSRFMDDQLVERSFVTCMTSINKSMDDKDAVSCLVVASESCMVYVLDPQGTTVIQQIKVPGVPVEIVAVGLLDIEYRLVMTTRNSTVYTIKNGELLRSVIELELPACGLVQLDKSIVIASMSRKLTSYHLKGKKNWSLTMGDDIVALEAFSLRRTKETRGVIVALHNGEVTLYNEKVKVCTLSTDMVLTGMRFGQYGREEASLVLVQKSGALSLNILKRTASLDAISAAAGPPPEQGRSFFKGKFVYADETPGNLYVDIPLNIPKKTTLYLEQTQRERDQATEMHRHFQRDLCKLRLNTARAYVKIIKDGHGLVSYSTGAAIRLNAQVLGIGPSFRIKLNIQNAGFKAVTSITVAFQFDHELYCVKQSLIPIPLLIPNVLYHYAVDVDSISQLGAADNVSIFVCAKESSIPLVSAIISMPLCESKITSALSEQLLQSQEIIRRDKAVIDALRNRIETPKPLACDNQSSANQARPYELPRARYDMVINTGRTFAKTPLQKIMASLTGSHHGNDALEKLYGEHAIGQVSKLPGGNLRVKVKTKEACLQLERTKVNIMGGVFMFNEFDILASKYFVDISNVDSDTKTDTILHRLFIIGCKPIYDTFREVNMTTGMTSATWRVYFLSNTCPPPLVVNGSVCDQILFDNKLHPAHGKNAPYQSERLPYGYRSLHGIDLLTSDDTFPRPDPPTEPSPSRTSKRREINQRRMHKQRRAASR
ncbi:putative bardet-Biedl syndrome 1 protein [Plasmopara halstedii]